MVLLRRESSLDCQHIYDRFLKAGCKQSYIHRPFLRRLDSHSHVLAALLLLYITRNLRAMLILDRPFCQVKHSRLQAAKTEIIGSSQPRTWQPVSIAPHGNRFVLLLKFLFSTPGSILNGWTTRITQTQNARNFVKSLSSSIIAGASKQLIKPMIPHKYKLTMGP